MVEFAEFPKDLIIEILKQLDPKSLFAMSKTSKAMHDLSQKAWKQGEYDANLLIKRAGEMAAVCTRNKQRIESNLLNLKNLRIVKADPAKILLVAPKISEAILKCKKELMQNAAWFDQMLSQLAKFRSKVKGSGPEIKKTLQELDKLEALIKVSVAEAKEMAESVTVSRKLIDELVKSAKG